MKPCFVNKVLQLYTNQTFGSLHYCILMQGLQDDIKMSQNQVYGLRQQVTTPSGSEIPTDSNLVYGLRQEVTTPSGSEIHTDSNLVYGLRQQVTTQDCNSDYEGYYY